MDLQMPEMDGFTATRLIRAQSRLDGIPIIAMTAHALVEERQKCLDAGMSDHVTKPIDPDTLLATLLRWAKPRQSDTQKESTPTTSRGEVMLPQIDGVDVEGGLKRVVGNKRLFRDLLLQFASKHANAPAEIAAAIESGDLKLAERIAHTVKGVAGNLGIGQVFSAAEKLEKALRHENEVGAGALGEFAQLISRQVLAIREALPTTVSDQPSLEDGRAAFNANEASAAIEQLRVLLESCDGDAAEAFPAVEKTLAGIVASSELDLLYTTICEFDFETALVRLDEIAATISARLFKS